MCWFQQVAVNKKPPLAFSQPLHAFLEPKLFFDMKSEHRSAVPALGDLICLLARQVITAKRRKANTAQVI